MILINRTFNFFYTAVKDNDFTTLNGALGDDTPELYKKIFNNMVHDNMAEDEIDEVALELGKLYLERGICYKLDLKHCTREEFQNMNEQDQAQIDYFSDDINEENGKPMTINNMHTRTGRGVKTSQMSLMTCNGKKSALDIAISMVETYRILNPGKSVPVLKFKNGDEDRHLLEMLVDKEQERRHNVENVSYWHDQKSEFSLEQINSGKESLGFSDSIISKKAETPVFSEQAIGKATVYTPLEQKQEAERVGESDIKRIQELEDEQIE